MKRKTRKEVEKEGGAEQRAQCAPFIAAGAFMGKQNYVRITTYDGFDVLPMTTEHNKITYLLNIL